MAKHPYGEPTRVPSIPDVRADKFYEILNAIKEWIEVRQGARGNGLDRVVTFRDLLNSGIATPGAISGLGGVEIPPIPLEVGGGDSSPVPPTPTNLQAAGAVKYIILTWDFARGYTRLAYFEVWRSQTDALGDAVLIAQVYEPLYADEVGGNAKFYYWVRAVSDAGHSNFNAVAGTYAETALDVEEVLDAINSTLEDSKLLDQLTIKTDGDGRVTGYGPATTPSDDNEHASSFVILADRFLVTGPAEDGVIPSSPFFVQNTPATVNGVYVPKGVYIADAYIMNGVITNAKIGNLAVDDAKIANVSVSKLTAGKLGIGAYIESTNYQSGATGFHINANGNAEFSNATVRGTIYATAGTIGGVRIENYGLHTTNYNGTTAGWSINAAGDVHFTNGTFRGNIYAENGYFRGELRAATGTFSGALSAATGTFAGRVHGGYFTAGSFTGYNWPAGGGTGIYLGPSGLLMGNAHTGNFFEVSSNGRYLAMPGMTVQNGVLTITAANVIDTLQLRGEAVSASAPLVGSGTIQVYSTTPAKVIVVIQAMGRMSLGLNPNLGSNSYAAATVNGVAVCYSYQFAFPIGTTGGDQDSMLYAADATTGVGMRNVSAGYTSISCGAILGGRLNCQGFVLLMKR